MKIISIASFKGGVGKTTTAYNMAYILAKIHNKKVLLVDNDKQANLTRLAGIDPGTKKPGIAEILLRETTVKSAILHARYCGDKLHVIHADMSLIAANKTILLDRSQPPHTRLKQALYEVRHDYNFCIIDNAPDLEISTVNALVSSDDIIIPAKLDGFTVDGIAGLLEQINNLKEAYCPNLKIKGCLITNYLSSSDAKEIKQIEKYIKVFGQKIRYCEHVISSIYAGIPITFFSPRCAAAIDYRKFAAEYLYN